MAIPQQPGTERIGYFDGQLLASRDLQDDTAYQSRLRGLHVRYIHKTWGIALGYEVHVSVDGTTIAVGPGIAYDASGREVVSSRSVAIAPPGSPPAGPFAASWWDLAIRYLDTAALLNGRDLRGSCGDSLPNEERPDWRWHFAGDASDPKAPAPPLADAVRLGVDIPMARFRILNNGQAGAPDFSLRHYTQGLVRPHIFSARLDAGSQSIQGSPLNWSLAVDTSAGGFSQTPLYFVTLETHPLDTTSKFALLFKDTAYYGKLLRQAVGPFVSIQSPGRTGFTLEVHTGLPDQGAVSELLEKQTPFGGGPLPVAVHWLGIETTSGCPPVLNFFRLLFLSGFLFQKSLIHFSSAGATTGSNP